MSERAVCIKGFAQDVLKALTSFTVLSLVAAVASAQISAPTEAPKPLSPEASAAAFKLLEGFRMEVVASEPLIGSPSAACWDERGRMFVSELHGYDLAGQLDIEELNKTGTLAWLRGSLGTGAPNAAVARKVNDGDSSAQPDAKPASHDIPKFGIFEQSITQQRTYCNPYVEGEATPTFIPPNGRPGHSYCLADPGQNYIVYTENTKSADLFLDGSPNATYRVT